MNKPQDEGKGIDDFKKALYKDFEALLVKEFTTDWKVQRMIMKMQIDVMDFDNVIELVRSCKPDENWPTDQIIGFERAITALLKRLGATDD